MCKYITTLCMPYLAVMLQYIYCSCIYRNALSIFRVFFSVFSSFPYLRVLYMISAFFPLQRSLVPELYTSGRNYLIASLVVFGVQLLIGTVYLLCCGLEDAVGEGIDQLEQETLVRQGRSRPRDHE